MIFYRFQWFFLIILLLSFFISLVYNFVLWRRSQYYYEVIHQIRLDPLGLNVYGSAADDSLEGLEPRQKVVVFFGDSRAYQWPFPSGLPQFKFVNRGIHSQTSLQTLERLNAHLKPLEPDIVIVQVGVNDLRMIHLFPEQKESLIADCKANIAEIVSQSRALGAIVILSSIFPLGELPLTERFFWSPDVAKAIDEVNAFLLTLKGEDVHLFETYFFLVDEKGIIKREYSSDFLHLNERGYNGLNHQLAKILRQIDFDSNQK
jgi:lysophospholipase L1-like esterase